MKTSQNFILEANSLEKTYIRGLKQKYKVLHGLKFSLPQGSSTAFLGMNGSGKTTTIKCLMGFQEFDKGSFSFFSQKGLPISFRSKIGYATEKPFFFPDLNCYEVLIPLYLLSKKDSRVAAREKAKQILKVVNLFDFASQPVRSFSKGMQQRLSIAQSLIHQPELLILDEPMSGLDPEGRFIVRDCLKLFKKQGGTLFMCSHHFADAQELCERTIILKNGLAVYEGALDQLFEQYRGGVFLQFIKNGEKIEKTFATLVEGQDQMQKIISEGGKILEFRSLYPTLEEAFVKIVGHS